MPSPFQMTKRLSPVRNICRNLLQIEAGFSLLELLIVLLCFAALFSLAVPGYSRMADNWQLRSSFNQFYADVKECQSLAVVNQYPYSIKLTTDREYEIWAGDSKKKSVRLPKGISFSEPKLALNGNAIQFNSQGHPIGAGTVMLGNLHHKKMGLTVHLHTGQIQLREGMHD